MYVMMLVKVYAFMFPLTTESTPLGYVQDYCSQEQIKWEQSKYSSALDPLSSLKTLLRSFISTT